MDGGRLERGLSSSFLACSVVISFISRPGGAVRTLKCKKSMIWLC